MVINSFYYSKSGGAGKAASSTSNNVRSLNFPVRDFYLENSRKYRSIFNFIKISCATLLDNYVITRLSSPFFSILRSRLNTTALERINHSEEDIYHLHWMPGLISLNLLQKSLPPSAKIVVTLHDHWFLTGGCHYSSGCEQYLDNECSDCPFVRRSLKKFVRKEFAAKKSFFNYFENVKIITPSNVFYNKAIRSPLLKSHLHSINTLHNFLDPKVLSTISRNDSCERLKLNPNNFYISFISHKINEPRKGLTEFVEILNRFAKIPLRETVEIILAGRGFLSLESALPTHQFNARSNTSPISDIYNSTDILLFTSSEDNSPLVLDEAKQNNIFIVARESDFTLEALEIYPRGFIYSNYDHALTLLCQIIERLREKQTVTTIQERINETTVRNDKLVKELISLYGLKL